jgi:hypothetical protein
MNAGDSKREECNKQQQKKKRCRTILSYRSENNNGKNIFTVINL